jgi:hypothetical protein
MHVRHVRVNNLSSISQVTSLDFLFNYTYVNMLSQQLMHFNILNKDLNINSYVVLMMLSEL